ncbi:hypothetical protein KKG22_03235 [Patescibacteria group bacterium]|nr:hypothetical protein [Patescibacteria group bacterium]MBU1721163.1 hypothetical protein [Patescibacteria group bacterium]MBU1900907.1 hypothetical protein [Patescibacteria group bacterium]
MEPIQQKGIEYFFEKYNIQDPDKKAAILPRVTHIIYDYNMLVVSLEKELEHYKREQIIRDIQELEQGIDAIFQDSL